MKYTQQETVLDNININYNFIILPISNDETFTITNITNTFIFNSYPKILDLTSQDSIEISFSLPLNGLNFEIKLSPENDKLNCDNLLGMLNCIVPLSHFDYENSGYFNMHYLNSRGDLSIYYEVTPFKVLLPERKIIQIKIKQEQNTKTVVIGTKGTLYFITDYIDTENIFDSDIEETIKLVTTIFDEEKNNYEVNCRLFKPTGEKLAIICNLAENLKKEIQDITLRTIRFQYKEYNITIISETSVLRVNQLNYTIPFIYSDHQNINMSDGTEIYELKFKFDSYNDDLLIIEGKEYTILDTCQINEKDLICKISIEKIESVIGNNNELISLGAINDNFGALSFHLVYAIEITHQTIQKEDVYISITNLIKNITELNYIYAYDTNITTIDNLHSKDFTITTSQGDKYCYFKKNNFNNLLVLCYPLKEGETCLGKIENEIIINDTHYKYNFRIQPVENTEIITTVKDLGTLVKFVYPQILNFTSGKLLIIRYLMINPPNSKNIKLNIDSPTYLECTDLSGMKKCKVPINHFKKKESGYYHTHYLNSLGVYSTYYDANPVNIELPEWENEVVISIEDKDNPDIIKIGQKGVLYFVTNYNDTDNIFIPSELETFSFKGNFTDSKENNLYESICKFWKPKSENMRIICQLDKNMANQEQNIYMQNITFIYNENYTIGIEYKAQNIKVKQLNYEISFLYSEKQEINIKQYETTYKLVFKQYKYDNRPLYLYQNDIRSVMLDNCKSENKEVSCDIIDEKILQILSKSKETYSLVEKLDNEGLYEFNSVLDISFTYEVVKRDLEIKIGKLLTPYVSKNEFIAYETTLNTNLTFPLMTNYFEIGSDKNQKMKCLFKKSSNQNPIFLLCNALNEGKNSLGTIEQITFDDINIYYNIKIQQSENTEEFDVSNEGAKISSLSPLLLNFKEKDTYTIRYETENPDKLTGIKLNIDSSFELDCVNTAWYKDCKVNQSHFTKDDHYYTYHSNHMGSKTISYEASMINVILKEIIPDDSGNPSDAGDDDKDYGLVIGLSIAGGIIAICLIILLIWCLKRRNKNSEDIRLDLDKKELLGVSDTNEAS